jgi:hypothetical protein
MNGLDNFLNRQRFLAKEYVDFLQTLDPNRTMTLIDMLSKEIFGMTITWFPWLKAIRLQDALENACNFLDSIPAHSRIRGWDYVPLIFIQLSDPHEDQQEHNHRLEMYPAYRSNYAGLPAEVRYGPTEGNISGELVGSPKALRIAPLGTFSSCSPLFIRSWQQHRSDEPLMCGYRVPVTYPSALEMTHVASSVWIAQVITHDIGHFFLPEVGPSREGVHNTVMVNAMGLMENGHTTIPQQWDYEALMFNAAVDPLFFMYGAEAIEACERAGNLTAVGRHFVAQLKRYYSRPSRIKRRETLWGITPEMDLATSYQQVLQRIESFKQDGFAIYDCEQ